MPIPTIGDLVWADRLHLVVDRASGADIAYGHPVGIIDPAALVELRDAPESSIIPATRRSRVLVEAFRGGVPPHALPELHARVTALAAES